MTGPTTGPGVFISARGSAVTFPTPDFSPSSEAFTPFTTSGKSLGSCETLVENGAPLAVDGVALLRKRF